MEAFIITASFIALCKQFIVSSLIQVRQRPICSLYFRLLYQEEKDRTAQFQGQLHDQHHDQLQDLEPSDLHHALHHDLKLSDPDQHHQDLCLPHNRDTLLDHLQHVHITTIHTDQEVQISHHLDTYQITDQSRLHRQPDDQYLKGLFGIMMPQKVDGIKFVDKMCQQRQCLCNPNMALAKPNNYSGAMCR